jgi:hypothetical protein
MSRNFSESSGSMNFFSFSSSSLYHEMLSDVRTNQYGLELPAKIESKARFEVVGDNNLIKKIVR